VPLRDTTVYRSPSAEWSVRNLRIATLIATQSLTTGSAVRGGRIICRLPVLSLLIHRCRRRRSGPDSKKSPEKSLSGQLMGRELGRESGPPASPNGGQASKLSVQRRPRPPSECAAARPARLHITRIAATVILALAHPAPTSTPQTTDNWKVEVVRPG
jgi:hypothetical protein